MTHLQDEIQKWVGRVKRIKQVKLKTRPKLKVLAEFIRDGKFYKTVLLRSGVPVEVEINYDYTISDEKGGFTYAHIQSLLPDSTCVERRIFARSTPTFLPGPKVTFWHEEKQMFVIDTLDNYVAFKAAEKLERTKK